IAAQPVPLESQRCHWYEKLVGLADQVPVRVSTAEPPLIVLSAGRRVFEGAETVGAGAGGGWPVAFRMAASPEPTTTEVTEVPSGRDKVAPRFTVTEFEDGLTTTAPPE